MVIRGDIFDEVERELARDRRRATRGFFPAMIIIAAVFLFVFGVIFGAYLGSDVFPWNRY